MNSKLQIIGIGGTNGAGKDAIAEILSEKFGYLIISVSELLRDEARKRGEPIERQSTRKISAEWRKQSGPGVLVDKAMAAYQKTATSYTGVVISSLRNPGEADRIHELSGTMIWVDADPKLRYARIQAGAASRARPGDDQKTYQEFLADELTEMQAADDENGLHGAAVKEKSDVFLENNSQGLSVLENSVRQLLQELQ